MTLTLEDQEVAGDIITDEISEVNCYLKGSSALVGAVNPQNAGKVYVELASGATWELSQDSFVDGLTCDEDAIVLKGNVLTVGGVAYEEGTVHTGEAIEFDLLQVRVAVQFLHDEALLEAGENDGGGAPGQAG